MAGNSKTAITTQLKMLNGLNQSRTIKKPAHVLAAVAIVLMAAKITEAMTTPTQILANQSHKDFTAHPLKNNASFYDQREPMRRGHSQRKTTSALKDTERQ